MITSQISEEEVVEEKVMIITEVEVFLGEGVAEEEGFNQKGLELEEDNFKDLIITMEVLIMV